MRRGILLFVTVFLLISAINAFAGTTGKISGQILDESTGDPLIGANIVIMGTTMGASTDLDGYYAILNIPPGVYTLQAMYIGYNTKEVSDVRVSIDLTTKIDVKLAETTLDATEMVTVVAERPAIKKDLTATTSVVGDKEIDALPVTEINEILELQAGYVDGHMRGGRSGEVAYWIDGIPVTDSYDGETVVDVNKNMVQELQVVSGAFNAEYGNAMSGIVNVVTKGGSNDFGGSMTAYIGDNLSSHDDIFMNISDFNPASTYNFEGSLNGAIVKDKVFYYVNARHIYFHGWNEGKDVYDPNNVAFFDDTTGTWIPNRDDSGKGEGDYVPMNWNRKNYAQAKLIFKPMATINLLSNTIYDQVDYQDYDRNYKYNPGGDLNRYRTGFTQMFKMTHTLAPTTFYDLGVTYFMKEYKHYAYEDPYDPRYVHPDLGSQLAYSFKTGGTNNSRFKRETYSVLTKFDITSQVSRTHQVKAGLEYRNDHLKFQDITLQPVNEDLSFDKYLSSPYIRTEIPADSSIYAARYDYKPIDASVYLQDKMEFKDFILNIGVRFDYFDPDGQVLADPTDPELYDPVRPENRYHDLNENGVQDAGEPNVTVEERRSYWYKDAEAKFQISPRIGAAFPVSEGGKVYFSYGYFFQRPKYELLYTNPDYDLPIGGSAVVGNADLEPEKTIQGEIGIQQQITDDITVDATIFFRDVRDLTGTTAEQITVFGTGQTYSKYVNSDFGLIKGFIVAFNKRFSAGLSARLDYTYQIADGTASDPQDAYKLIEGNSEPEVQLKPLDWDQRHTINASVNYSKQSWGVSFIGQYGSGLPYTPRKTVDISSISTNNGTKPATYNIDLKAYKDFMISDYRFTAFLRVFNLLDQLNEIEVYDDTGRAGQTIDEVTARETLGSDDTVVNSLDDWFTDETHYNEPRRVEFGLTFNF